MTRLLCIAAALLIIVPCAAADEDDESAGKWALQFRVDAERFGATLEAFDGTLLSIKHQVSPSIGLRAGVSLTASGASDLLSLVDSDTTITLDLESDRLDMRYGLDVMWYPRPERDARLFIGGGPHYSRGKSEANDVQASEMLRSDRLTVAYGMSAFVGVEWQLLEVLSLHAEYGASLERNSHESTLVREGPSGESRRHNESTSWSFGADAVLVGLSAYF